MFTVIRARSGLTALVEGECPFGRPSATHTTQWIVAFIVGRIGELEWSHGLVGVTATTDMR